MLFNIGDTVRVKQWCDLECCCTDEEWGDLRFELDGDNNVWFEKSYERFCGQDFQIVEILDFRSRCDPNTPDLLTYEYILSDVTCENINELHDFFGCELFLELVEKAPELNIDTKPLFDAVFGGDDE